MKKKKNSLSNFRRQSRNANKHTGRGLDLLDKSIRKNGWIGAMTAANDGEIFDGSARLDTVTEALPVDPIVIETDGKRPIIIKRTDIKKASDPKAVRLALEANRIAEVDLNWDVDVLGEIVGKSKGLIDGLFSDEELKKIGLKIIDETEDVEPQFDKAKELQKKWKVKSGDLWEIGTHRLMCGDSTKDKDVKKLTRSQSVNVVLTDPPYNYDYDYKDSDDNKTISEYIEFTKQWTNIARLYSKVRIITPGLKNLSVFATIHEPTWICAWVKKNAMTASRIGNLSVWEPIIFEQDDLDWEPVVVYGKPLKRVKRDVYEYPIRVQSDTANHPCPKLLQFWQKLIEDYTNEGDVVLDLFGGSGTTAVGCQNLGRKALLMEFSPAYCAVILQRLADMGLKPKLIKSLIL